jgi:hypothetical protein
MKYSENWPLWRLVRNLNNAQNAYGGITLAAGSSPAMNGVDTNYGLVNVFDTAIDTITGFPDTGVDATLSPDYSLTVGATGDYRISFWASFSSSAGGALVTFRPHINNIAGPIEVDRDVSALDTGSAGFTDIINYTVGDVIDIRVKVDTGTSNLTFLGAGLNIHRLG